MTTIKKKDTRQNDYLWVVVRNNIMLISHMQKNCWVNSNPFVVMLHWQVSEKFKWALTFLETLLCANQLYKQI